MDTKVYPIHIHRKYHDIYTKGLDTDITQLKYQETRGENLPLTKKKAWEKI